MVHVSAPDEAPVPLVFLIVSTAGAVPVGCKDRSIVRAVLNNNRLRAERIFWESRNRRKECVMLTPFPVRDRAKCTVGEAVGRCARYSGPLERDAIMFV